MIVENLLLALNPMRNWWFPFIPKIVYLQLAIPEVMHADFVTMLRNGFPGVVQHACNACKPFFTFDSSISHINLNFIIQ